MAYNPFAVDQGGEGLVSDVASGINTGFGRAGKMAEGTAGAHLRKYRQRLETPVQDTLQAALARRQFGTMAKGALGGAARRAQAAGIGGSGVQYTDPVYGQVARAGADVELGLEQALQRQALQQAGMSYGAQEGFLGSRAQAARQAQQTRLQAALGIYGGEQARKQQEEEQRARETDMLVQGGMLGASVLGGGLPWLLGGGGVGIGGMGAGALSRGLGGTGTLAGTGMPTSVLGARGLTSQVL